MKARHIGLTFLIAAALFFVSTGRLAAETLSAYAPRDQLGPKWSEMGWIDDTYFPWVYSYTYENWYCVLDGANVDAQSEGYWLYYFTPDGNAYGWGYVFPGAGWWCYTLDRTAYWLRFGQSLPADGKVLRVTMMIDDGPSANTSRLLAVLADKGVTANFDLIGVNCEARPEDALAIRKAGHTITNHSYQHQYPTQLTDSELTDEVVLGNEAIANATGEAPLWYWAPYCYVDQRLTDTVTNANLNLCLVYPIDSSNDYLDTTTPEEIKSNILSNVADGSILLFHEWRDDTVEQMPSLIDELREKGCVFLPYAEMDAYLRSRQ